MNKAFFLLILLFHVFVLNAQSVKWLSSNGGANGNPEFRDLATDSQGNIYAIGSFNNATINVNATPIATRGGYDAYLVKYNSNGVFQWIKTIDGTGTDISLQVETDAHSGIKNYDVFVVVNDTLTYKLLSHTRADLIQVKGKIGSTYKFYSVAIDQVGNIEELPSTSDAVIRLQFPTSVTDRNTERGVITVYPTVTNDFVLIKTDKPVMANVFSATGQPVLQQKVNGNTYLNLSELPSDVYIIKCTLGNQAFKVIRL